MAQAQTKQPHQLGVVKGPGTATSDSIPAKLSKGEYIIPAHIVKQYGKAFFNKLIGGAKEPDTDDKGRPKLALGGSPKYDNNGRLIPDKVMPIVQPKPVINPDYNKVYSGNYPATVDAGSVQSERVANNAYMANKAPGTGIGPTRQQLATIPPTTSEPIDTSPWTGEAVKPVNPSLSKVGSVLGKTANAVGELGKGLAIGEALQTGKRAIYNALPKNPVTNILGAGGMALTGDTEAAKKMLFGQPVNNLSPLAQGGVDLVRKVSPNAPTPTGTNVNQTVNPTTQPPRQATSVNKPAIPNTQAGSYGNNGNNGNTAQTALPTTAPIAGETGQEVPVNPATITQTGNNTTFTNGRGGLGNIQWQNNRKLSGKSKDYLGGVLAREANPDFQNNLAQQAQIVNDRFAVAKQQEAERQQAAQQAQQNAMIQNAQNTLLSGNLGGKRGAAMFLDSANQQQGNQQRASEFGQEFGFRKAEAQAVGQTEAAKMAQTERLAKNKAELDWQLGARNKFGTKLNPTTGELEAYPEQGPIAEQQWADTQQSKQAQSDHQNVTAILKTPDKYDPKVVAEAQRHANTPAYKAWLASQKG